MFTRTKKQTKSNSTLISRLREQVTKLRRETKEENTVKYKQLSTTLRNLESEFDAYREETRKYLTLIHDGLAGLRVQLKLVPASAYNSQNQKQQVHKIQI